MEVTYSEIALGGVSLSLCRRCAGFISGWLSADIAVGTRQRGGFEGDFTQVENTVRTNLRMLSILGIAPSDEELASLIEYARNLALARAVPGSHVPEERPRRRPGGPGEGLPQHVAAVPDAEDDDRVKLARRFGFTKAYVERWICSGCPLDGAE